MGGRLRAVSALAIALTLLALAMCSSPEMMACVPGQSIGCVGAGGCAGRQVCAADGKQYGACECMSVDAAIDAPTIDTGVDASDVFEAGLDVVEEPEAGVTTQPWGVNLGRGNIRDVAIDSQGNVIVGGRTSTNSDDTALFEKLDSAGNKVWLKSASGSSNNLHIVNGVAFDAQGNAYAVGYSNDTSDFGSGPLTRGAFIIKFDSSGKFLWQHGGYDAWFEGVVARSNGSVIAYGEIDGATDFGGGTMTTSFPHALIVELDSSGKYVRAKQYGSSSGPSFVREAVLDGNGNLYVAGNFQVSITFGGNSFNGPSQGSSGYNLFVAKLDTSFGHVASIDLKVNDNNAYFGELTVDSKANLYLTGFFSQTMDFGGGTLTANANDAFLAKLDTALKHQWSKRFGDGANQYGGAVDVDLNGNVVMAGAYAGSIDLGCGALSTVNGNPELYIAVIDSSSGSCRSRRTTDKKRPTFLRSRPLRVQMSSSQGPTTVH